MSEFVVSEPAAGYTISCSSEDRELWLSARNSGIGASEIALLLGASDWGCPLAMYYRKIGEVTEPDEQTETMQWGLLLEGAILAETARRAEVMIAHHGLMLRSVEHPWATATPDGLTAAGEPVEVKNVSHGFDASAWAEQIPEKYMLQCQQQMMVTGAARCLFGALLWGSRLVWEWVPRDEERIRAIIRAGSEFWGRVERRDPPASNGHKSARAALAQLATDPDPVELFHGEISGELSEYEAAREEQWLASIREKAASKRLAAASDALAMRLGKHTSGATATGWSIRWKTTERRGFTVAPTTTKRLIITPPEDT